jgi:hypothetical protein
MTQEGPPDDLPELAELYSILRQDAKHLTKDLVDGIEMTKMASTLMIYIAVLGVLLAATSLFPAIVQAWYWWQPVLFVALSAIVLVAALYYRRQYARLIKKYRALYDASKKLK